VRSYLHDHLEEQSLHNQLWALWASKALDGVLNASERNRIVDRVFAKQQADGGWNLASLGDYKRLDDSPADTEPDGYATGLAISVLRRAGLPPDHAGVAKGLTWLRTHQQASGAWVGRSVNKRRDPNTHVGRFMSDAATAFAVLALDPSS
jgi:squalene-hopene/tetraprenyl-beta-curcumene cyclase